MFGSEEEIQWDPNKDAKNRKKHGVSFAEASAVFFDENQIDLDPQRVDGEDRYVTIGLGGNGRVLVVVWCERGAFGEIYRIISARKATRNEIRAYQEM